MISWLSHSAHSSWSGQLEVVYSSTMMKNGSKLATTGTCASHRLAAALVPRCIIEERPCLPCRRAAGNRQPARVCSGRRARSDTPERHLELEKATGSLHSMALDVACFEEARGGHSSARRRDLSARAKRLHRAWLVAGPRNFAPVVSARGGNSAARRGLGASTRRRGPAAITKDRVL